MKTVLKSVCIILLAIWLISFNFAKKDPESVALSIKGFNFDVTLADTAPLRQKGLGNRQRIDPHEGMLFLFDSDDLYAFWMKDMNFPIDIIWIDNDNKVVDFVERVSPDSYPQAFRPKKPARKVLEIQAGRVDEIGIEAGDEVSIR